MTETCHKSGPAPIKLLVKPRPTAFSLDEAKLFRLLDQAEDRGTHVCDDRSVGGSTETVVGG